MAQLFTSAKRKSRPSSTPDSSPYQLSDLRTPSSPYRTFSQSTYSSSLASSSTSTFSLSSTSNVNEMPRSSSDRASLSGDEKHRLSSSDTGDSAHKQTRRRTNDQKMNVYTACGRHGDDWLFGGFSVSGAMKTLWEKKE